MHDSTRSGAWLRAGLLLLALVALPVPKVAAQAPEQLDTRPGAGEQCIVCGEPIRGENIVELRWRGRTFHVGAPLLEQFLGDPEAYFRKLENRSALFDERGAGAAGRMSTGWLWFGAWVLAGLVFGAACGYVAISRALPSLPWFFAGFVGNVAALAVLLGTKAGAGRDAIPSGLAKVPATAVPLPCPSCGHRNHPNATECSRCHAALTPPAPSEARLALGGTTR